jgi:hypothetical protein
LFPGAPSRVDQRFLDGCLLLKAPRRLADASIVQRIRRSFCYTVLHSLSVLISKLSSAVLLTHSGLVSTIIKMSKEPLDMGKWRGESQAVKCRHTAAVSNWTCGACMHGAWDDLQCRSASSKTLYACCSSRNLPGTLSLCSGPRQQMPQQ